MAHAAATLVGCGFGGAFGPNHARDPRALGTRGRHRQRAPRTVFNLPAGNLAAHPSARGGGADRASGGGSEAAVPTGRGHPERTGRISGDAPQSPASQLQAPRSPSGEATSKKGQTDMSKLVLETEGETFFIVKRRFDAPPEAVYRAHLEPEII